jgi:Ti-type conjugative transfer relaxase TraA
VALVRHLRRRHPGSEALMLNIGRLGADGADYYLSQVVSGVEDYYTGSGEAPGYWLGSESEALGLAGLVDANDLAAVLDGRDPASGESLGAQRGRKVPGFDLTFRAPKSVSILWGLGRREVSDEVRRAHDQAVLAALGYVEAHAAGSRRGRGGAERINVSGLVAAAFRHRSSRAGDPLLHTHVVVTNLGRAVDDRKLRTLDSRRLYAHAKTAGYVYQAQLRYELTRRLGVEWTPMSNGTADLAGIDEDIIRGFSQRRVEIEASMAARGETSAKAAQTATLATRRAKEYGVSAETLHTAWWDRAQTLGVTSNAVERVIGRVQYREHTDHEHRRSTFRLLGPAGLTENDSTFTRRDVVRAWCEQLPSGAPAKQISALTDQFLERDDVVRLVAHDRADDERSAVIRVGEVLHTTGELLATERRALDTAIGRQNAGAGIVHDDQVAAAVVRRPSLGDDQAKMVRRITTSGAGVEAVVGKAGAGKTFALDAAREAWQSAGYEVIGTALAARAAAELQDGSGIPSGTLHGLLDHLRRGTELNSRTVVVVDEAGMVGTRQLASLIDHCAAARAKLVLVGDPYQLPAIEAGGLFHGLVNRLPTAELTENRRQHAGWERAALNELRSGDPSNAINAYNEHDRIVTADNAETLRDRLVEDWCHARAEHGADSVLMIAARRSDVDDLNARARIRMKVSGQLTGAELTVNDRSFQAGDDVICLRNDRSVGILNGTRGTVTSVDLAERTLTLSTRGGASLTLPPAYLDASHVDHGYAITGHKAQGMTSSHAFVLGSDSIYREWGYVSMSRGRGTNRLYAVADGLDVGETHEPSPRRRAPRRSLALVHALRRVERTSLAVERGDPEIAR